MFGVLDLELNYFALNETTQIIMRDACSRQVEFAFIRPFLT
jgi:hypothetical protein